MLKPDGVKREVIRKLSLCLKGDFKVLFKKKVCLKGVDLENYFFTNDDYNKYYQYLTGNEVIVYLVKGKMAVRQLYVIKNEIRNYFNIQKGEMFNLIHSSNHGVEYLKQFTLFFPELKVNEFSLYADLVCLVSKNDAKQINYWVLKNIEETTNLHYLCFILENYTDLTLIQTITTYNASGSRLKIGIGIRYQFSDGIEFDVYSSSLTEFDHLHAIRSINIEEPSKFMKWTKEHNLVVAYHISDKKDFSFNCNLVQELKQYGLHAVSIYNPIRSLRESQMYEQFIEDKLGLIPIGGSDDIKQVGNVSIDQSTFDCLFAG